jgi:glyoxylase-like metal-dependent hydrolase (beta-lactamase superfamily II)
MHRDEIDLLVTTINRRGFLGGVSALVAAGMLPKSVLAQAAPKTFMFGDNQLTVLSDGNLVLPLNVLAPAATPEQLAEIAGRLGWTSGSAEPQANIALIRSGDDLILVDNGAGAGFPPTAGKLAENMKAAGVDPASITKVVFTHAHPDHIWGTLSGGALLCPNAAYYVGETEHGFWTNPDIFNQLPADFHAFAQGAQRDLGAVKDRLTLLKGGDEVVTGIEVIDTPGHTPGHIALAVAGGDGLIIAGDVTPNEIVSLEHPDWAFGFDAVPDVAIQSRKALIDRAASDGSMLLGYHFAYPGVGKAERDGDAYRFAAAG